MANKNKFFKLGPVASLFHDAESGLTISGKVPGKVESGKAVKSKKVSTATGANHIIEIDEAEYNKLLAASVEATTATEVKAAPVKTTDADDDEEDEDEEDEEDEKPKVPAKKPIKK